jgi:hypothetical protein
VKHAKSVKEDVLLDYVIERGITLERRALVDLDQPWFCPIIQKNVHAKNLETMRPFKILTFGCFINMRYLLMPCYYSFYT